MTGAELDALRDQWVRIPAGTPFRSTHPSKSSGLLGREVVVQVHHVLRGGTREDGTVVPAMISYAGSGGYWKEVPADVVIIVKLASLARGDATS